MSLPPSPSGVGSARVGGPSRRRADRAAVAGRLWEVLHRCGGLTALQLDYLQPAMPPAVVVTAPTDERPTMTMDGAADTTRLEQGHDRHLMREARQRLQHEREACIGQRVALEGGTRHVPDELTLTRLAAIRVTLEEIDAALVSAGRRHVRGLPAMPDCHPGGAAGDPAPRSVLRPLPARHA